MSNTAKAGKKSIARRDKGSPPKLPKFKSATEASSSMLAEDTKQLEWQRRSLEQAGEGHYGKVHAKERRDDQAAPEGELQNDIPQHPLLNRQPHDGIPINDSNLPPQNTEARREMENAKRLQHQKKLDLQKQLDQEYQPSSTPTPRPGG